MKYLSALVAGGTSLVASAMLARSVSAAAMVGAADKGFVTKVGHATAAEIGDAHVAEQNSSNPTVLAFARKMIADHGAAGKQLGDIATTLDLTVPDSPNPMQAAVHAKLTMLHGAAFDSAYLHGQMIAHQKTIAVFKTEISSGSNPKLVAFAKMTLPTIEGHLQLDRRDMAMMSK